MRLLAALLLAVAALGADAQGISIVMGPGGVVVAGGPGNVCPCSLGAVDISAGQPPNETDTGYFAGVGGTLSPDVYFGNTVFALLVVTRAPPQVDDGLVIVFSPGGLAQSFFTSMTVNGVTVNSASADHFSAAGCGGTCTSWGWDGVFPYSSPGGSFTVTFTP